jgi:signal transduction histidine kinase
MSTEPVARIDRGADPLPPADAEAGEHVQGLSSGMRVLPIVPLVGLVGAMVLVALLAPERVHPAPLLLFGLNLAFTTLVSFFVLYLALRGFLVRGQPSLLLLGCGAMVWGTGALLATTVGWSNANASETIENSCALLSGAFHLGAVVAWRMPRLRVRELDRTAVTGLGVSVVLISGITAGALTGAAPVFFVQGQGATAIGRLTAGGAVASWALAAAILATGRRPLGAFTFRYAMALALFAVGLAGDLVEASIGDWLDWLGRAAQAVGGLYMLAAALSGVRDAAGWALSLEAGLAEVRTRLREREALYQAFFENMEESVALYEPVRDGRGVPVDWIVLDANERYAQALGLERRRILGARFSEACGKELLAEWSPQWREVLETGRTLKFERGRRGRTIEVTCFRMGGLVAGTGLDVTEQRRMEQAVRDSERLYRESDGRKSEFLAVLSHELRNPLAPVRSAVEVLAKAPDGPEARRARDVIERQVGHLARLVDDLLDVTRVSRGKVTLTRRPLDLREAIVRACEDHRPLFDAQGIALRVEASEPVAVDADPTRVAQIAGNLLQNASRFTPRGGTVTVALGSLDGRARLRVADDGIGIEPALLGRVFEPFTQLEPGLARNRGGLGLGLTLVKGLVELHGGTVQAESAGPGRGAAFTVTLPLAAQAAPRAVERPHLPRALDIVVVDDSRDAADALVDLLRLCGHRVRLARDGRSGIALVRSAPPDVLLLDIGLPDVDGYEVARTIRADAGLRSVLLVALSGYARPEDRARAAEAGFDAHLAKPASLEDMEAVLARADGRRG